MLTFFYSLLLYLAAAVFIGGIYYRVRLYIRTPQPYAIPIMPAPRTRIGVVLRMCRELLYFESLYKANRLLWIFSWVFHASLFLIFLNHLRFISSWAWPWALSVSPVMSIAAYSLPASLLALLVLRIVNEQIRYISTASDYLWLLLLLSISITGLLANNRVDLGSVQGYVRGLVYFEWLPLPRHAGFLLHVSLAISLFLLFPFSKLLHAPGVFFSPTRTQADSARKLN